MQLASASRGSKNAFPRADPTQELTPYGKMDAYGGRTLRARRNEVGLSQGALGRHLGLTFSQVQKYEKGTNRPGFRTIGAHRGHGGSIPVRCPSSWPGWRQAPTRRPFQWGTAWCAGGGGTCNGGSRIGSGWSCTSGRWASTWRRSATGGSRCARGTRRPIRRRRRLSKKLPRGGSRGDPRGRARQAARGLVPGRGPRRPAGHAHPGLGQARNKAAGAARHPLPVGLHLRRGLPGARRGRGPRHALRRHRRDE